MSVPKRAYDILRGYVSNEWDRLQKIDVHSAEKELEESLKHPAPRKTQPSQPAKPLDQQADPDETARRILGVAKSATFATIRKAYVQLSKRSNPENFPADPDLRARAEEIHHRVEWAYRRLTADIDETQKRFGSLEID